LQPSQVAAFIGEYSWKELEQVGADEYRQRYLNPMGRTDAVMEIEQRHAEPPSDMRSIDCRHREWSLGLRL
jgi:hypothetical protein